MLSKILSYISIPLKLTKELLLMASISSTVYFYTKNKECSAVLHEQEIAKASFKTKVEMLNNENQVKLSKKKKNKTIIKQEKKNIENAKQGIQNLFLENEKDSF